MKLKLNKEESYRVTADWYYSNDRDWSLWLWGHGPEGLTTMHFGGLSLYGYERIQLSVHPSSPKTLKEAHLIIFEVFIRDFFSNPL